MIASPRRIGACLACALATTIVAAGCGGSSPSSAPATTPATTSATPTGKAATSGGVVHTRTPSRSAASQACRGVPTKLAHRILAHTVLMGAHFVKAEAAEAVATPGYYYVSTEVTGGGAKPGSVATWVTKGLRGRSPIYAVDSFAALISTYGASTLKSGYLAIDAPGAYRSRVCASGKRVSAGLPAPQGGGHTAPAAG